MESEDSFTKKLTQFLYLTFKKEVDEESRLENKYQLIRSKDEMEKRRILQDRYKYYNIQSSKASFLNGTKYTWSWLRKYYISLKVRDSIDKNNYAKYIRKNFAIFAAGNMLYGLCWTFLLFIFMRALKQKGSKDMRFLFLWNSLFTLVIMENNVHLFITNLKLPMNDVDLERRKELLEKYVFSSNRSFVLNQQLKFISTNYYPNSLDYTFLTPTTGQNITYSLVNGRLYLKTDNYSDTFGYISSKAYLSRIQNLNVNNIRERDIIFGLFNFYDLLIQKYKEQNGIKPEISNETMLIKKILHKQGLTEKDLKSIENSNLLSNIDFDKIRAEKIVEQISKPEIKKYYI